MNALKNIHYFLFVNDIASNVCSQVKLICATDSLTFTKNTLPSVQDFCDREMGDIHEFAVS